MGQIPFKLSFGVLAEGAYPDVSNSLASHIKNP